MLVNRLKTAKEKWPNSKLKTEHLKNVNLPDGHPLMVMKVICAADIKIKFKGTYEHLILADATNEYKTKSQTWPEHAEAKPLKESKANKCQRSRNTS